jgi:hypothetical protein
VSTEPHLAQMTPNERGLALRWLEKHQTEYDLIVFQRVLGPTPVHHFEEMGRVVTWPLRSWGMRPDALAWQGAEVTIVEFKASVGFNVIRQMNIYAHLASPGGIRLAGLHLLVVGGSVRPGVREALAQFEITLELLPEVEMIPFT